MNIHQPGKIWDGAWYAYWLTADGTEDGSRDMVVDGSVTPIYFWHTVPEGVHILCILNQRGYHG